ncbi:MarR family transcriptional regulator [Methanobrevibacter sp. TMH8]|uniref:winged helix-turn-helix domain-containing protein n=1 Tax=Methanobrevibacter sp. TMH8 TaxID=2848611 RepID=UPI001CCD145B|nr:winged helix-turn-helix domain-containing protein [Methanobrevibacter sp. TMH8]MBZ9570063.1 MarR family transcriptional regulator [Methanobrevibacter sp. TMH8]
MKINDEYLEGLSAIKASKQKQQIIKVLSDQSMKIPSEIGYALDLKTNHISVNLRELKEMNIVKCLNEEKKKGRLYCITNKGMNLLEFL